MSKPKPANICPSCGSTKCCGLMASFFVELSDPEGDPMEEWADWVSESYLTRTRSCNECGSEWEDGD